MGNRLYVGNLSFNTDADTIRNAFAEFGDVSEVYLVSDRVTGQSRGFGFVTMGTSGAALKAMEQLNGVVLEGRALKVSEAEERQSGGRSGGSGGGFGGRGGNRSAGSRW
jgi:cold-inducible RNA-binding protein